MSDEEAMVALRAAFAGEDDASAAWSQTAPEVKARCVAFVASAQSEQDRASRARQVAQLAAAGPIREAGPDWPGVPDYLQRGFGGGLQ